MTNETLNVLKNHKSIRAFTDKPVSDEMINTIFEAATAGPNINNFQPVIFIEITDQAFKAEVTSIVGMDYIEKAARYFVLAVDFNKDLIGLDPDVRKAAEDKISVYPMLEGGIISAGIALGRAQVAAESLGLGTVTMAGALGAFELYEQRLNLPKFVKAVMGFSIGYPNQEPGIKPKLPLPGFVMKDHYDQEKLEKVVANYDKTMQKYYADRGVESSWIKNNTKMFKRNRDTTALENYPKDKGFTI
ncbi:nitroreductase family protein [Leuconostoc palmae]|uniref:nitroreductase family protein n=1 Tax=Leuconostoc palmae TaxID=501487 RepID=UPI001C7D32FB|nr:nitroreductase family protein [Leuconostoc palmae]